MMTTPRQSNNLTDIPDDAFIDANCDGIDGVLGSTIFVAETTDPAIANGTTAPYQPSQQGCSRGSPDPQSSRPYLFRVVVVLMIS